MYQNIFFYVFLNLKRKTRKQKTAKETKEVKKISVENLTGYDDIDCKFSAGTSSSSEFLPVVHMNLM